MLPVDEVPLLEGEHVKEGAEVAAVVDLITNEGSPLLALGLCDAVRDHPRHGGVREALGHINLVLLILLKFRCYFELHSLPAFTLAPPVSMTKVADGSVTGILPQFLFEKSESEILNLNSDI